MRTSILIILFLLVQISVIAPNELIAQTSQESEQFQKLSSEVLHSDSLFWEAYNTCNLNEMETFLTGDLEFYHDQGGLTSTLINFIKSIENGICANENWRLRREVVEGSVKVYPLNNYGAILIGEHYFYVLEKDKMERLDGKARFTHVWEHKKNELKMSRILSYDHQPIAYKIPKIEATLSDKILTEYVGNYESSKTGSVIIAKEQSTKYINIASRRL